MSVYSPAGEANEELHRDMDNHCGTRLGGLSRLRPTTTQTNGDEIVAGDMLNSVMDYIKANHADAAAFITEDMNWTETVPDKRPGYTGVTYSASGWTVTIGHAVTPEIIYDVRAEYLGGKIVWVGTIKDSLITELSYTAD